ncbi:uncharacterized protein [Rutidosis leptorrhynchoides]|uniref:uncharacterized protein n=1 Tax=Rutidosis leptorrhynchoides TaxID=125765 RepID=UPI003A9A444D
MSTENDPWIKSAINDTALVANILFQLRQSNPPPSHLKRWSIRQRRSKPVPPSTSTSKKQPTPTASPTTPLSYSTSVSGEESSRLILDGAVISRSKVIGQNETPPTKRPRKKKTLAELKEDETTLLKERKQLKRQIATLQATCQNKRLENESLKKMKNDLQSQQHGSTVSEVHKRMEEKKDNGFVLPDLNVAVGEDY